jgi:hypothetical protein
VFAPEGTRQARCLICKVNVRQAIGPNTSTGPPRSCESRTPTTAPSWPTSAQLPDSLAEDFRQAPTSAHAPLFALAVLVRQAATSAQLPLLKLCELLRHPFTVTTSAADVSIP